MLSVDEYERICTRQRERLVYGEGQRERLCNNATVLVILAGILNRLIAQERLKSGLTTGVGQACAALSLVSQTASWWREHGEDATEAEMSERLLLANQHVDNAIRALRPRNESMPSVEHSRDQLGA
ncbi:MAG: hypothetical protein NVS2B16_00850 [Chloroflexota bacterium]